MLTQDVLLSEIESQEAKKQHYLAAANQAEGAIQVCRKLIEMMNPTLPVSETTECRSENSV